MESIAASTCSITAPIERPITTAWEGRLGRPERRREMCRSALWSGLPRSLFCQSILRWAGIGQSSRPPIGAGRHSVASARQVSQTGRMSELEYSESIVIARAPQDLYDMVSDVTRMGEWSPVCRACWWDDRSGPNVGSWFTGRNELPERTWETRSQVMVADPGREFAFVVGASFVRWGYTFAPVEGGTQVTESWEFLPDGHRNVP